MLITNSGNLKLCFFSLICQIFKMDKNFNRIIFMLSLSPPPSSLTLSENIQTHIDIYTYKYTLCEYTKYNFNDNIFT